MLRNSKLADSGRSDNSRQKNRIPPEKHNEMSPGTNLTVGIFHQKELFSSVFSFTIQTEGIEKALQALQSECSSSFLVAFCCLDLCCPLLHVCILVLLRGHIAIHSHYQTAPLPPRPPLLSPLPLFPLPWKNSLRSGPIRGLWAKQQKLEFICLPIYGDPKPP